MVFLVRGQSLKDLLLYIIERSVIIDWQDEFLGSIYQTSWKIFDGDLVLLLCLRNWKTEHVEGVKCN